MASADHSAPALVNLLASLGGMTGLVFTAGGWSDDSDGSGPGWNECGGSGSRFDSGITGGSLLLLMPPSCPLRAGSKPKPGHEPASAARVGTAW